MTRDRKAADYWADWLLDAIAGATQDRRLLRGDPAEDRIATEAILLNGKKAIENFVREQKDTPAFSAMRDVLEQIEGEMNSGLGSSYGETREQVRRALALARKF